MDKEIDKDQLKLELEKIKKNLDLESMDDAEKSHLSKLLNDINNLIERSDIKLEEKDKDIVDELKTSLTKFEVKNPEFSESMNIIIHTLSNLGI